MLDLRPEHLHLERRRLQVNRQFTVDRAFGVGKGILPILCGMRWRLLRPVDPSAVFITSDRPVAVVDARAADEDCHSLVSPGAEFTLPLTKEVMMLGDRRGPPTMSWAASTTDGVRHMNGLRTGPGVTLFASTSGFLGEDELLEHESQLPE
jgi:hypothetical protein